jgi:hypothetical protein
MTTAQIIEPQRSIEVCDETDVLVAGAGPAGVVAALAAARSGASVRLIDVAGCLGGVWTAGLLCWIIGADNKGGLIAELAAELDRRGARAFRKPGGKHFAYDPEVMKLLLEQWCADTDIRVQLHTRLVAAQVEAGRLTHVITESASGRQAWAAQVFIDCTGNGDLAQRAGCGFDHGRPTDGAVQPMSLPGLVAGIRFDEVEPYVGGTIPAAKKRLGELCRSLGVNPTYPRPMLVRIHDELFGLICDHQFGRRADDAADITAASMNGRRELHELVDALRNSGGVWKDLRIVATCEHIGVRECRRVHGRATITEQDIIEGRMPEDSIAVCRIGWDVHTIKASKEHLAVERHEAKPQPYGLPLRSLIARDVEGLMMAGRCISGDFWAHSSYRVTGDAAALGQAAGVCAARAAEAEAPPQDLPFDSVRDGLQALNAPVPV